MNDVADDDDRESKVTVEKTQRSGSVTSKSEMQCLIGLTFGRRR